jgi:methylmalonyl-CoA mutase
MAIQMIINHEWGLGKNENPGQGAFIIEELTDLVEEAVLQEFERISERGGVLGAMETGYQRGKIQDESLTYETLKHDGRLPIIGVNTFRNPEADEDAGPVEMRRSSEAEKQGQIARLRDFQARHADEAPVQLKRLQETAAGGGNVFAVLMEAVRHCSLGQITDAQTCSRIRSRQGGLRLALRTRTNGSRKPHAPRSANTSPPHVVASYDCTVGNSGP